MRSNKYGGAHLSRLGSIKNGGNGDDQLDVRARGVLLTLKQHTPLPQPIQKP